MPYYQIFETKNPSQITTDDVLAGYVSGYFPMGDKKIIRWFIHIPRAIVPIHKGEKGIKISRSLRQVINKSQFEIRFDYDFASVINQCAKCHRKEGEWITKDIIRLYTELHRSGYAHSVEAYQDDVLCGGLYGVAINSAFFGESMFHLKSNASKVCFVKLFEALLKNNFTLFDTQMLTPLLESLGAVEIDFEEYLKMLDKAISKKRTRQIDFR